jgi:ParE toxin of type II toxin-antitoxin system, parDE
MPSADFHFHRLAAQEFRAARSWYAHRSRGTAGRFVVAVDRALHQISEDPERWPFCDARHRWVKVKKFPYLLIYRLVAENLLAVVAFAHASRRPGNWRRRRI